MTIDVKSFTYNGFWEGPIEVPWLGGTVHAIVESDDSGIDENQIEFLGVIQALPSTTLEKLKSALFEEYQNEIYGSITAFHSDGTEFDIYEITPKTDSPNDVYSRVKHPTIFVRATDAPINERTFAVMFECKWDDEHGIGLLIESNGKPREVGDAGDFL